MALRPTPTQSPQRRRALRPEVLAASLYHAREQRRGRITVDAPVISTGTPNGGNIDLTGTAWAGAEIKVTEDGQTTVLGHARANKSGNWSMTVGPYGTGTYDFVATATILGATSPESAPKQVVVP